MSACIGLTDATHMHNVSTYRELTSADVLHEGLLGNIVKVTISAIFFLINNIYYNIWSKSKKSSSRELMLFTMHNRQRGDRTKIKTYTHKNEINRNARAIKFNYQAPVVQTMDSAVHRINHYPADKH